MQTNPPPLPAAWLIALAKEMQWPVVVAASFWVGRRVRDLEARLSKAEGNLTALIDRHMPAIHRALADIRAMLQGRL